MGAKHRIATGGIVDLRQVDGSTLDALLREEILEFREFDWDFSTAAGLVRRLAGARALAGCAVFDGSEAIGYGYSIVDERKGCIGDVYVRWPWRDAETEAAIFMALFDGLVRRPEICRIESQLVFPGSAAAKSIERERGVTLFERSLMTLEGEIPSVAAGFGLQPRFRGEAWTAELEEWAAQTIASAYAGHVDAGMNDQYRTVAGARRLVRNLVHCGACGFCPAGSFVAFDGERADPAGVVLASFVAAETGHIGELCVAPESRGAGLGHALLSRAVAGLRKLGAKRVNLTVTRANADAVRLYERCGFRETRRFFAYAWEHSSNIIRDATNDLG